MPVCVHAHVGIHVYTRTHARTRAHTHTHTHMRTHAHAGVNTVYASPARVCVRQTGSASIATSMCTTPTSTCLRKILQGQSGRVIRQGIFEKACRICRT